MPRSTPLPIASRAAPPACRRAAPAAAPVLVALAALAALSAAPPALAQAARYELDPVHTRVMFELSHAGYSQAIGTVSGSTGVLLFDPADWTSAKVSVRVPIAKLDLGDDAWNRAALGRGLLDGARHPVATFVSTRVEPVDATHARVFGTLTLRGTAREIALDVAFNQLKRYSLPPFRRTAGFSATATLSRAAFGADAWSSLIGDQVSLRIEAEAHRASGAAELPGAPDAADGRETPDAGTTGDPVP